MNDCEWHQRVFRMKMLVIVRETCGFFSCVQKGTPVLTHKSMRLAACILRGARLRHGCSWDETKYLYIVLWHTKQSLLQNWALHKYSNVEGQGIYFVTRVHCQCVWLIELFYRLDSLAFTYPSTIYSRSKWSTSSMSSNCWIEVWKLNSTCLNFNDSVSI